MFVYIRKVYYVAQWNLYFLRFYRNRSSTFFTMNELNSCIIFCMYLFFSLRENTLILIMIIYLVRRNSHGHHWNVQKYYWSSFYRESIFTILHCVYTLRITILHLDFEVLCVVCIHIPFKTFPTAILSLKFHSFIL